MATDIVRAINDEEDYTKGRNYWKYLKGKMTKKGVQLVSVTHEFKFEALDGKQRAADCVQTLAKHYPNNRASLKQCVDWSKIDKKDYLDAMRRRRASITPIIMSRNHNKPRCESEKILSVFPVNFLFLPSHSFLKL